MVVLVVGAAEGGHEYEDKTIVVRRVGLLCADRDTGSASGALGTDHRGDRWLV